MNGPRSLVEPEVANSPPSPLRWRISVMSALWGLLWGRVIGDRGVMRAIGVIGIVMRRHVARTKRCFGAVLPVMAVVLGGCGSAARASRYCSEYRHKGMVVVDRLEGHKAVLFPAAGGPEFEVPVNCFPAKVEEGMWLVDGHSVEALSNRARSRVQELLKMLNKHGTDADSAPIYSQPN